MTIAKEKEKEEDDDMSEEQKQLVIKRRADSFRRANDIRYKDPKDLKWYQRELFYEIKIREEIKALEDEIEKEREKEKQKELAK